jgi:hypothetical protein
VVAVLGLVGLASPAVAAVVLGPAVVFGQVSAIMIGNWGSSIRIQELGFWNAMRDRPPFGRLWPVFCSQAKARSLWPWVILAWVTLGGSAGLTLLQGQLLGQRAQGRIQVPYLAAFLSFFFLVQAILTVEAMVNRELLNGRGEPARPIEPD